MSNTIGLFYPTSFYQGDDFDLAFTVDLDGLLIDPSDVTIEGSFRLNKDDPEPQQFTIEVDEENSFLFHARFSSLNSETLEIERYNYQIRMTNGSYKETILFGTLDVKDSPL